MLYLHILTRNSDTYPVKKGEFVFALITDTDGTGWYLGKLDIYKTTLRFDDGSEKDVDDPNMEKMIVAVGTEVETSDNILGKVEDVLGNYTIKVRYSDKSKESKIHVWDDIIRVIAE